MRKVDHPREAAEQMKVTGPRVEDVTARVDLRKGRPESVAHSIKLVVHGDVGRPDVVSREEDGVDVVFGSVPRKACVGPIRWVRVGGGSLQRELYVPICAEVVVWVWRPFTPPGSGTARQYAISSLGGITRWLVGRQDCYCRAACARHFIRSQVLRSMWPLARSTLSSL